jgi:membrane-associated phospholipid phosphatase
MVQARTDARRRSGQRTPAGGRSLPRVIGAVLLAFVLVEALVLGLGILITRVLDDTGLHTAEGEAEKAIQDLRDPSLNGVTAVGSWAGATVPIIVLGAIACLVLWRLGRGPRFAAFLAVAVVGETLLFLIASVIIDRNRPDIPHLDEAPPTSSFPSGHTAASVALTFGLVIALYTLYRARKVLAIGLVLAALYAGFVLVSRLYRGMHWPTDVATSVLFASVWLLSLKAILLPGAREPGNAVGAGEPLKR